MLKASCRRRSSSSDPPIGSRLSPGGADGASNAIPPWRGDPKLSRKRTPANAPDQPACSGVKRGDLDACIRHRAVQATATAAAAAANSSRGFERRLSPTMRQHQWPATRSSWIAPARKMASVDRLAGEAREAVIFVAVLRTSPRRRAGIRKGPAGPASGARRRDARKPPAAFLQVKRAGPWRGGAGRTIESAGPAGGARYEPPPSSSSSPNMDSPSNCACRRVLLRHGRIFTGRKRWQALARSAEIRTPRPADRLPGSHRRHARRRHRRNRPRNGRLPMGDRSRGRAPPAPLTERQDDHGDYCWNTSQVEVSGSTEVVIGFAHRGSGATGRPRWGTPVCTMWPSTSLTPEFRQGWPETDYGDAVANPRIRA
jgi:hypothetical protein